MWNNACLCKVLILAIFAMDTLGFRVSKPLSRQQIYLDVLRNITHVHQILNELLGNYKTLKAIYEAQAKPQNELSAEIHIDDEHRPKKNKPDFAKEPDFHPVTQMILFDEVFPEESSDKSNENVYVKEKLQPQFPENIEIYSNSEKNSIEKAVKPNKNIIDLTRTHLLPHTSNKKLNTSVFDSPLNLSNKPEMIIVGTALKYSKGTLNKKDEKIKTTERGYSSSSREDFSMKIPILRASYNNDDIRKVRYADYRYKELNQPRKWRSSYASQHRGKEDIGNSHENKTVLVLVVNREQKDLLFKSNKYDSDNREEEKLRREQTERKILRDAYGNACLKVTVRKCYKTLMQVRKIICTIQMRCKGSFKEKFKSNSKVGCMTEFNYKKENVESQKNHSRYYDKNRTNYNDIRELDDSTRAGSNINYYQLCLPVLMTENTGNTTIDKKPRDLDKIQPINVLRDRFEKECKRLSIRRCERACLFAVTNTCEKCTRRDKKSSNRTCKEECRQSFGGGSNSDSDDDTDSDDDSDNDDSGNDDSEDSDGNSLTFE